MGIPTMLVETVDVWPNNLRQVAVVREVDWQGLPVRDVIESEVGALSQFEHK